MGRAILITAGVLFTVSAAAQQQRFDGKRLWRHVEILAADNMEGRGLATNGLKRAEAYVVGELRKAGVKPAGEHGYLQPVRLTSYDVVERNCRTALVRNGRVEPLVLGDEAVYLSLIDLPARADAPLVFVGYGLRIPEANYDDLAGLDLKGKIAVTVAGFPEGVDVSLASRYAGVQRRKQFHEAGLAGWIMLPAANARWATIAANWAAPIFRLANDESRDGGAMKMINMSFNPAHADRLFAGTGHTAADLLAAAGKGKTLPRFPLGITLRAQTCVATRRIAPSNIVATIEGSDPLLRNEYVVVSAHIDGLGTGTPVRGDGIYNGAIDNASGVAALLDIAATLKREGTRPRRSVLFTFFTAHEFQGSLIGSKHFMAHPTVKLESIVANINIDQIQAVVPLKAILVLGEHESDIGDSARRIAAAHGLTMDVDLTPERNRFSTSSDQATFARAGIPAIKLNVGFPGDLNAVQQVFIRERYHTPSDDAQQPINFDTIAKYQEVALALLLDVANGPRPRWKPGSPYAAYAK